MNQADHFIKLTAPAGTPVFCQPDDVKAVKVSYHNQSTVVLLYGAEQIWLEVSESPEQVLEIVGKALNVTNTLAPSNSFPGRN